MADPLEYQGVSKCFSVAAPKENNGEGSRSEGDRQRGKGLALARLVYEDLSQHFFQRGFFAEEERELQIAIVWVPTLAATGSSPESAPSSPSSSAFLKVLSVNHQHFQPSRLPNQDARRCRSVATPKTLLQRPLCSPRQYFPRHMRHLHLAPQSPAAPDGQASPPRSPSAKTKPPPLPSGAPNANPSPSLSLPSQRRRHLNPTKNPAISRAPKNARPPTAAACPNDLRRCPVAAGDPAAAQAADNDAAGQRKRRCGRASQWEEAVGVIG